jgi:hypothetical protein
VRLNPGPPNSTAQPAGRTLLELCRDHEPDVLRFTTDTRIWPTNNISERGVRPAKTQQKISGRFTSEGTTHDRLDIRSYIDTIRKHGADVLASIHAATTGNPWRPTGLSTGLTARPTSPLHRSPQPVGTPQCPNRRT